MSDRSDTNEMQTSMAHFLGATFKNLSRILEKVLPSLFNK